MLRVNPDYSCYAVAVGNLTNGIPLSGVAGGVGGAVPPGIRPPAVKPPRDYGPGKDNPWDRPPEKQQEMWIREGVVWDPETLSWRPPRPGEIPPPKDYPEEPTPFQRTNPRDKTPWQCLGLYDDYVMAQARILALQGEIAEATTKYWDAQRLHNANLAKFTLLLGWDVGSLLGGDVAGVRGARGLTQPGGLGPMDTWKPPGVIAEALAALKGRWPRSPPVSAN